MGHIAEKPDFRGVDSLYLLLVVSLHFYGSPEHYPAIEEVEYPDYHSDNEYRIKHEGIPRRVKRRPYAYLHGNLFRHRGCRIIFYSQFVLSVRKIRKRDGSIGKM